MVGGIPIEKKTLKALILVKLKEKIDGEERAPWTSTNVKPIRALFFL